MSIRGIPMLGPRAMRSVMTPVPTNPATTTPLHHILHLRCFVWVQGERPSLVRL